MTTNEQVADSVDKLMFIQGKRNKDLAELLDVTHTQAGNLRNGRTAFRINDLFTVAQWLGVRVDDLAQGYELTPSSVAA